MKRILPVLAAALCFNFLTAQTVFKDYKDGRLYIKCSPSLLSSASGENPQNISLARLGFLKELAAKYGITKAHKPFFQASDDAVLPYILKLEFSETARVSALIEELSRIRGVEYAEKVPVMKTDITPNDPVFPAQLTQINAQNAWNVFNGSSNITLAIVDNAVMWTHQDLVANTYTNTGEIPGNNIDDDNNGYIDDVNGWDVADGDNNANPSQTGMDHGTHCAGIAGARNDNGTGIASIGWNIKIIPVKTTANGGNFTSIDDGYGGIIYAARAKARVISCSWGGAGFSNAEQAVINYAWIKGSLIVAAAGNNNTNALSYPGAYANVYCVASVSSTDVKSGFSNYGTWVDIAAPGENIYSTAPSASTGSFNTKSGTSMATPLVAGLAALMLSKCPYMTQTDVINCISSTAVNIYTIAANSTYSTGSQLGAGRIEAFQAMNCANGYLTMAPLANFFAMPRNTCPNTAVSFYDSSLYVPTVWSWTFQGGTPATSTFSNPSVSYANPGTYSVQLTVSNGNGTNTATKLSYITVAGPIALPLVEGFQTLPFLPANWTEYNELNDNIYWKRANWTGGFGTSTACAVFDNYNTDAVGERDEMRTPKYSFTSVAAARLRFDVAYARYNSFYSDTLEVKLSTNCGLSWTSIYLKGGSTLSTRPDLSATTFTPTNAQWRTDSIDISLLTAGQGNVMFSFINRGHYGQAIYLDNINLAFPTPTLNASATPSSCASTAFSLSNTSTSAASYTWSFPGGAPATSTASNPSVSYASAGLYTMTLLGLNGTSTASITRTVNIVAPPAISINTPAICSGNTATLTASGATSYSWTNGPMSFSMAASPLSTTVYTVTGESGGCSSVKTGTVLVNATPTITVNSPTICSGNTAVISPTGAVSYSLNGAALPGSSATTASLAASTNYTVTGSTNNCAGSKTLTVFVNATPTLSINNPTVCLGSGTSVSVTGAASYSWSNGATGSSLLLGPASTSVYTATGTTQGCSSSISSTVLVQPLPTISIVSTPTSVCGGSTLTLTANGALTYTWAGNLSGNSSVQVVPTPTVTIPTIVSFMVLGTDANLCGASSSTFINVMVTPAFNINVSPAAICLGGSATLNTSGSYTSYAWSGPAGALPSNTVSPAATTAYTVVANGTGGCTTSSVVIVPVSPLPSSTLTAQNSSCGNSCSGSVNATTGSGTGPYSYSLSGNSCNSLPCINLCAGSYTLITSDAAGCSSSSVFAITAPANNLSSQTSYTDASCATCPDGVIATAISGGQAPYTYTWEPSGGNQAQSSGLLPGCYTVTISDAAGCSIQSTACVAISVTTGISQLNHSGLQLLIYPNPAQKAVTVEYQSATFDYTLYNSLGQLICRKQNNESSAMLDLEGLAKGVYFIEVEAGEAKNWKKLLIE